MENKKWLIDANVLISELIERQYREQTMDILVSLYQQMRAIVAEQPTVVAYTEEQMKNTLQFAEKMADKNKELEKECAWLKNCLNCKIRKECPRHCGKVVHNCDHWEYGDATVDAIPLTAAELNHLINDTIAYIWRLEKRGHDKPEFGYDSRKALLEKLKKFHEEHFPEITCPG